ncbi:MAG: RNA-binding protein [Pseudomonadota bacterium]
MSINIYVGNLSFDTSEEELRELFELHGAVLSAKIIKDQFTGRSKGFGFVEMPNRDEGMNAIKQLDSTQLGGRTLKINEARPRGDSGPGDRDKRSRW